jgi:predicted RNA methylase
MQENEGAIEIIGNDVHGGALELAEASLARAGGLNRVVGLHQNDCNDWTIFQTESNNNHNQVWVTTNPPWGVRLTFDDSQSWESLRTFLRTCCPPGRTQAWVLSGNKHATKHLGLRRSQSFPLKTGQQDLRWIKYIILDKKPELVEGETDYESTKRSHPSKRPPAKKLTTDDNGRRIRTRSIPSDGEPFTTRNRRPRKVPATNKEDHDDSWI